MLKIENMSMARLMAMEGFQLNSAGAKPFPRIPKSALGINHVSPSYTNIDFGSCSVTSSTLRKLRLLKFLIVDVPRAFLLLVPFVNFCLLFPITIQIFLNFEISFTHIIHYLKQINPSLPALKRELEITQ